MIPALVLGVLSLAAIAVCSAWRRRFVPLVTCIGLVSLAFAFGGSNPFHGIAYSILPVFEKARTPLRILSVFDLAMAVLAAAGMDALALTDHGGMYAAVDFYTQCRDAGIKRVFAFES